MQRIAQGIGLGVGFVIGAVLIILLTLVFVLVLWKLYKVFSRKRFTADLFKQYSQELLHQERFEELNKVQGIIKLLEQDKEPKEMLQQYEVDINTDLEWAPTPDGGEKLVFRKEKRIVKRRKK